MTTNQECCGKCSQPGCTVEKDGTCLEGFENLLECPHFIPEEPSSETPLKEQVEEHAFTRTVEYIELHDGEGLRIENAGIVMRKSPTKIVVVAGTEESGKTTLLASLYECFQEGDFGGMLFAGSKTLRGFERRCHLARISSEAKCPDTERTKPGDEGVLLHLRTRDSQLNEPQVDVLLTDISGEIFKLIRSSSEECKRHEIIRRADHFVLLLDGAKIIDPKSRQQNYISGRTLLRSCLDSGMLGPKTKIEIVLTKWDLLHALSAEKKEEVKQFIDIVHSEIRKLFSGKNNVLEFFEIAARPVDSDLPFAYGLGDLFICWLESDVGQRYLSSENEWMRSQGRSFERYSLARFS